MGGVNAEWAGSMQNGRGQCRVDKVRGTEITMHNLAVQGEIAERSSHCSNHTAAETPYAANQHNLDSRLFI